MDLEHPLSLARRTVENQFRSFDDTLDLLDDLEPETCIEYLKDPLRATAVKKRIRAADGSWISAFLDIGGLDVLWNAFKSCLSDGAVYATTALLRYIECIKALLSHTQALDLLVSTASSTKYVNQLLHGII